MVNDWQGSLGLVNQRGPSFLLRLVLQRSTVLPSKYPVSMKKYTVPVQEFVLNTVLGILGILGIYLYCRF